MSAKDTVTITDMMNCRERRANLQTELIQQYQAPVLSFCMNIPGPVKTDGTIAKAFDIGKEQIYNALLAENISINKQIEIREKTGDELILSVDSDSCSLKRLMSVIEETHPLGRIFDIDIIDESGSKLSRSTYRTCLLCGKQAQECARSRTHSVEELFEKIHEMITDHCSL